jgi:hypothetical protein
MCPRWRVRLRRPFILFEPSHGDVVVWAQFIIAIIDTPELFVLSDSNDYNIPFTQRVHFLISKMMPSPFWSA